MDFLEGLIVVDVIEMDVLMIDENWELEEVFYLLVDLFFLLVVIEEWVFKGIIIRKELFKVVNFMVYELECCNILFLKIEELKE